LSGTIETSNPAGEVSATAAALGTMLCLASSRTWSLIPSPGRKTFTRVMPMPTAIAETTTV